MRRCGLLLLALLSGCSQMADKGALVAQCKMEAARIYSPKDFTRYDEIAGYVDTCMRAKGFVSDVSKPPCSDMTFTTAATDESCYKPR